MAEIKDTGKVWIPGAFGTEYAVRVDDKVFVLGKGENDTLDHRVVDNTLYVDLHDKKRQQRTLRRFSLDLPPTTPATLFNGFEKTKHADIHVVTHKDSGVKEHIVGGDSYRKDSIAGMDSETFYQRFSQKFSDFKGKDNPAG